MSRLIDSVALAYNHEIVVTETSISIRDRDGTLDTTTDIYKIMKLHNALSTMLKKQGRMVD